MINADVWLLHFGVILPSTDSDHITVCEMKQIQQHIIFWSEDANAAIGLLCLKVETEEP